MGFMRICARLWERIREDLQGFKTLGERFVKTLRI